MQFVEHKARDGQESDYNDQLWNLAWWGSNRDQEVGKRQQRVPGKINGVEILNSIILVESIFQPLNSF